MYLSRNSWNGKIDDHGAHEACFKSKIEYSRQTIKVCNSYRMNSTTTLVNLMGFLIHCASVIPGLCETRLSLHHYRTDRWTHLGSFNCSYDSTLMLLFITGPSNFQHQVQSIFFANNCFEFFPSLPNGHLHGKEAPRANDKSGSSSWIIATRNQRKRSKVFQCARISRTSTSL